MADTEEYLNEEVTFMQPLKILSWDPKNKNDTTADITRSYTFIHAAFKDIELGSKE